MQMRRLLLVLALGAVVTAPAFAHGKPEHGGQVVEVQEHQFELVVEPEAKATHLDFYITDPAEKPVSTARVKLAITTPDGQRTDLPLKYAGGHYTALLPGETKGEYRVVALSAIGPKKLNARFTFKR